MKEVVFLNKNVKRWKETEKIISEKQNKDPDYLSRLYIQITDDLAYAKTFFPETQTEKYLNSLASAIHQKIYKTKKEEQSRFVLFWTKELPEELFYIRKYIFYSFLILFVSFLIGWISAENDNEYGRMILGDSYVNMTIENIKNGDPAGVYKTESEAFMFVAIAFNNIKVMFFVFLSGIFFSLGSIILLFRHGIMLAGFFNIFYEYNVLKESLLAVWIHGTIEIFTLVVAGGIGMKLGGSLLFPGTFKRKKSFVKAAKSGVKVVLGLVPFIVVAAFLEGFVTRHTEWNVFVRAGIIVLSFVLIAWYFFIFPYKHALKTRKNNGYE